MIDVLTFLAPPFAACLVLVGILGYFGIHVLRREVIFVDLALAQIVAFGAITAMLGVLLNLVLGLSRVLLAMGRRADVPRLFGRLNAAGTTPGPAVLMMGAVIGAITLIGDVRTTWSFSAFAVLVYYAVTNLAALRIPDEGRLFPRWVSVAGLVACAGLAFFVEPLYWGVGLGLLAAGLVWHAVARRARAQDRA